MAFRSVPLLPRLGSVPRGPWPLAPLLVAVIALGGLWSHPEAMPGRGDFMDGEGTFHIYWSLWSRGLSAFADDRWLMYPVGSDRLVQHGLPLDGALMWPFVALFGAGRGWTVAHAVLLAQVGLSTGWLTGRWWRSGAAAAVGGVVAQLAGITLRELAYGRPTQVWFLALLPLALGVLLDALSEGRPRLALVAGLLLGATIVSWWYAAILLAPVLAIVLGLAVAERTRVAAVLLHLVAGIGVVTTPVFLFVLPHLDQLGGIDVGGDGLVEHGTMRMRLVDLLAERSALISSVFEGAITPRPVLVALVIAGTLATDRVRRRLLPWLLFAVATVFALGPGVGLGPLDLPLPFGVFPDLPLLRRFWWPDRFLLVTALAVAVVAARAVARWRPALVVGVLVALVVEAWELNPWMPLPASFAGPSPASRWLAQGSGPALVVPGRAGALSLGAGVLRDQPFHQRPLLNGFVPADATVAPPSWQAYGQTEILAQLAGCEQGQAATGDADAHRLALRSLGATAVVVDEERFDPASPSGRAFLACVAALLGTGESFDGGVGYALAEGGR